MFRKLFSSKSTDFVAPMNGDIIPIEEVNDPVFAEKMIGDGFAIKFSAGDVYSPIDGEVVSIFPTNHALGLKSNDGNEFLLHIGLDTVTHEGRGFQSHVKEGQKINKGDILVKVDHDYFKNEDVDMTSPIIITNLGNRKFKLLKMGYVNVGDDEVLAIK